MTLYTPTLEDDLPEVHWMPLDGLAESWSTLGKQAVTHHLFASMSAAFAALNAETEARTRYLEIWYYTSPIDLNALEEVMQSLTHAHDAWSQALHCLPLSPSTVADDTLVLSVVEERTRVTHVLHQVEREHAHALHLAIQRQQAAQAACSSQEGELTHATVL